MYILYVQGAATPADESYNDDTNSSSHLKIKKTSGGVSKSSKSPKKKKSLLLTENVHTPDSTALVGRPPGINWIVRVM